MNPIIKPSAADFEQTVLQAPGVVAVLFWAPWNPACHAIIPTVEELAGEFEDRLVTAMVNIDEEQSLTERFNAGEIPMLLFFRNGQESDRLQGVLPRPVLRDKFEEALAR